MLFFRTHLPGSRRYRDKFLLVLLLITWLPAGAAPLDPPSPEALAEAKRIVQEMTQNQRGPYSQVRWFCNDGSVQLPVAEACNDHGGGLQHAVYSPDRKRLADLGWSVGTIFASLTFDELFNSQPRQQRLRELPLERFLVDTDDGWVLKRARSYRGRVQVEDEAAAGKKLLLQLLEDAPWAVENFLLVREASRVIPHGVDSDLARSVRRKAIQLAEIAPGAEKWRAEIHSDPDAETSRRLRAWADKEPGVQARDMAMDLAAELDTLFGAAGRQARLDASLQKIGANPTGDHLRSSITAAMAQPPLERISQICSTLYFARATGFAELSAGQRLALLDSMRELEFEVQLAYRENDMIAGLSRGQTYHLGVSLLQCAYAAGLLSIHELTTVFERSEPATADTLSLDTYRSLVSLMKRAPGWALGTVRHTFAEALTRYTALDQRAARFSDDLLRGSTMWMLGDVLKILSRDVDQLSGSTVEIAGQAIAGAVALNSGIARGKLRIFDTIEALEGATLARSDIAVIPETIAELAPLAGILTLGEGNALSHVQLLARNFGIPNVAIDYDAIELLRPLEGQNVLMVVTAAGDVLLELDKDQPGSSHLAQAAEVVVPLPDLDMQKLLVLDEVGRELSGKVVGPKAANLGELNRLFPGHVAPAIAIPFGIYAAHLDTAGLSQRISAAFSGLRQGTLDEAAFNAELASVRKEITGLKLSQALVYELEKVMLEQFGAPGSYGVFIRSDTNVEDLPQFTGAGLNETLPNVVEPKAQLAGVPRVWGSVLSPRALAWRSSVLANPEQIYASVLLMKSVPSTKSGVLVTTNLFDRQVPGLTASVAWGVGGAVAGEAAETITITGDGVEHVSEAKSPYQRRIAPAGGVDMVPAAAGRVLSDDEIGQLRKLAAEVGEKYVPVLDEHGKPRPWDIEFGFIDGALTLFQIRPLVERGSTSADGFLQQLRPKTASAAAGDMQVRLDNQPGSK